MFSDVTTLHFTPAGLAFCAAVPLLLALLIRLLGRLVPPAVRAPGAGVGGLLLLLLLVIALKAVFALFTLCAQAGDALRVIAVDRHFLWPALKATLPAFINAAAVTSALVLLLAGRSKGALFAAIAAVWVAGPGDDLLGMLILGVPFSFSQGFAGVSFFTIVATLYLLFSLRSALTYGLDSARRVAR